SGANSGQAQLVSGLILARYMALGGPQSPFGLPINEAFGSSGRTHQDFEGGYIDYGPGDTVATEHGAQRNPAISATPSSVVAGSRLRFSVTGFADGATLQISIAGQPDFAVTAATGSYTWDAYVPLNAQNRMIAIHAVDMSSGTSADGSYTVKALSSSSLTLAKTQGDAQSGAPGAALAQPLRVRLQDSTGNPVSGVPITFAASPGGQVITASTITDGSGLAQAMVRLPVSTGLALFTASSSGQVATFGATAGATSLAHFPRFLQSDAPWGVATGGKGSASVAREGALVTSAAGIVRYCVNLGTLSGSAVDPGSLNQYLQSVCVTASDSTQFCDGFLTNSASGELVANLWRIAGIVGGNLDVSVETPDAVV